MPLYDAFISYSHSKDKPIAAALQSAVQKLGKPWYRRRSLRLFRDDTSLSATPSLWPSIQHALDQSRYLILLASPEAAASPWVAKELLYWFDQKSTDTLLIAVTDGAVSYDQINCDFRWVDTTCLPSVLVGRLAGEPKWVDLRAYRGGDKSDARFTELAADFAATLHGMPKEDLLSQEVRQQRRALQQASAAMLGLVALAGTASWQWHVAITQRDRAEKTIEAATDTATALVIDLAGEFRNREGVPVEFVRRTLDQAQRLQQQLAKAGAQSFNLRASEGAAQLQFAASYDAEGNSKAALAAARKSLAIFQELVAIQPGNEVWIEQIAAAYSLLGDLSLEGGLRTEALDFYQKMSAIYTSFAQKSPNDRYIRYMLSNCHEKIGSVFQNWRRHQEALAAYRIVRTMRENLVIEEPNNTRWQVGLAYVYTNIGQTLFDASGRRTEAEDMFRKALAIREKLVKEDPNDNDRQQQLNRAYSTMGNMLMTARQPSEALDWFEKALANGERIAATDRGNAQAQRDLTVGLNLVGDTLLKLKRFEEALDRYRQALRVRERLASSNSTNLEWQYELSVSYGRNGIALRELKRFDEALRMLSMEESIEQKLVAADPSYPKWQIGVGTTARNIGDLLEAMGKREEASEFYLKSLKASEKLVEIFASDRQSQIDLAKEINEVGLRLQRLGKHEEALASYQAGVATLAGFEQHNPESVEFEPTLAALYSGVAAMQHALKRPSEALETYRKSAALLERMAAGKPNEPEVHRLAALNHGAAAGKLIELGRSQEALFHLQKSRSATEPFVESDIDCAEHFLDVSEQLADILRDMKRSAEMIEIYSKNAALAEKVAAADPKTAKWKSILWYSYFNLGLIDYVAMRDRAAAGWHRKALVVIESLSQSDPTNARWQIDMANTLVQLALVGDQKRVRLTSAQAILRRLVAQGKPTGQEAELLRKVDVLLAQPATDDDFDTCGKASGDVAIAACSRAIASGKHKGRDFVVLYTNRAFQYDANGDLDRAIADYNQAIRLDPKNALAYNNRGQIWSDKGNFDRAIADLNEAIRLDPKYAKTYSDRGFALRAKGDFDRAIADYNESIRLDPKDAKAYNDRGLAWRAKGDLDRAIADYNQAIALDPKDASAYDSRGLAYLANGDRDRAIVDFGQAISANPKYASAYRSRGITYVYGSSLARARADFKQAADLEPKDAYTALWLDIAERRDGLPSRLAQAAKQLDMAKWPAPLVRLFLGELTLAAALVAANDADAKKQKDQVCEANFYGAEFALLQKKKDEALRLYRLAASDCPRDFIEWPAAKAALATLGAK